MTIDLIPPRAAEFCNVLASARSRGLQGNWQGSAYRHHPCGVFRCGIIFCNEWNVNNYCYADVLLDPTSEIIWGCNDPLTSGNPNPRPKSGGTLRVYSNGNWSNDDGPWRGLILKTLDDLRAEIAQAARAAQEKAEADRVAASAAHAERVARARAAVSLMATAP